MPESARDPSSQPKRPAQAAGDEAPPMRCPICRKPSAAPASQTGEPSPFPFCTERCKLVDLGRWLDGGYQIPVDDEDLDETEY